MSLPSGARRVSNTLRAEDAIEAAMDHVELRSNEDARAALKALHSGRGLTQTQQHALARLIEAVYDAGWDAGAEEYAS